MPPMFGTSGLRGLVCDLTPDLVAGYVQAFCAACPVGAGLYVGRDLRPSSPEIASMVIDAARAVGVPVADCGAVPTPALALAAMGAGAAAVMVTGSHIPADRNGLKFYVPDGEISKAHEQEILGQLNKNRVYLNADLRVEHGVGAVYVARYVNAFGKGALAGRVVGTYSHATVGRDILMDVLRGLGAEVIELGRSDVFIPVDTEAVDATTRVQLQVWAAAYDLDAIMSLDGDGDRPLLTDATGTVIPGDVLGQITGTWLGAEVAVTPVSSNTGAEAVFGSVLRTKIGSPYVISGMQSSGGKVVGYEANGGFLLGFAAKGLAPLVTRDAVLPLVVPLIATEGRLAALVARQPARFTAADRVQDVATGRSLALVQALRQDPTGFVAGFKSEVVAVDETDGLRMTLEDRRIVHLRPSGNAPECRFYVEAGSVEAARDTLAVGLCELQKLLR